MKRCNNCHNCKNPVSALLLQKLHPPLGGAVACTRFPHQLNCKKWVLELGKGHHGIDTNQIGIGPVETSDSNSARAAAEPAQHVKTMKPTKHIGQQFAFAASVIPDLESGLSKTSGPGRPEAPHRRQRAEDVVGAGRNTPNRPTPF